MFDDKSSSPQLILATPENKARLRDWLAGVELGGGTYPVGAVRLALTMHPNAVFFLSDGEFDVHDGTLADELSTGSPQVPARAEGGRSGQVPIHTFAFESEAGRRSMRRLSMQTGGKYRFVPPLSASEKRRDTPTVRANKLLQLAIMLESSGKREVAMDRYQRIVEDFSNTVAASEARKRLRRLASPSKQ